MDNSLRKLTMQNVRLARQSWQVSAAQVAALKILTREVRLSVATGDLRLLDGNWYITHAGLVRLARRNRCAGINVLPIRELCQPSLNQWVFEATVFKNRNSKGFVGYGDADPANVSPLVRGAEMRVAETRAVNRALRKAYGIGLCSVEELGYASRSNEPAGNEPNGFTRSNGRGSSNGQPKLRHQLCLLIRKHNLDPYQVKRYAADFCGTEELRAASRELIESFVTKLAEEAAKDHAALICKLNSYGHSEAVKS
jgi:hypothetical protein